MLGIMATNEKDQINVTQPNPVSAPVASPAPVTQPAAINLQSFFVPDYNVSVKAESMDAAVAMAKELKGVE
jgi:hypothetical protein